MSRTDKTKPTRVRLAEHGPVPVHDHRDGICDLPESPLDEKWTGCHWDWHALDHSNCCAGCSCSNEDCSQTLTHRQERRRQRHETRVILGEGLQERERTTSKSRRKNTTRWCKGKVGREHVLEVRWAHWASWRIQFGKTCGPQTQEWARYLNGNWDCYHEIGCSVCGKVLQQFAPYWKCPIYADRFPNDPSVRILGLSLRN